MTIEQNPVQQSVAARVRGHGLSRYYILLLLGTLPLIALAVFAHLISSRAIERLVHAGNDTAALITAEMIEAEAQNWVATISSYAQFPTLMASVAGGDVDEVRRRLEVFVSAHPRLDRAFVADPDGLLWADFPIAPESIGQRFDDRDWYRGVTAADGPYISQVYRRAASPPRLVVAIAVPVRHPDGGAVTGLMVAQVRLGNLSESIRGVEVGRGGTVLLLDHEGRLVAHPSLDVDNTEYLQYRDVAAGEMNVTPAMPQRIRYHEPFLDAEMVASVVAAEVHGHHWFVVAQQPHTGAFAAVHALGWQLGGAGGITALLMGGLIFGLNRENSRRRQAERALLVTNEDLERRVEERTRALRQKEDELLQAQKMEAVGQLAGGVAHDFNNLLTVIIGSSELLLERLPADSPYRREVTATNDAAERAATLTRQLLAFSRKQVMRPSLLDVNETVARMRGILDRTLRADIELDWKLAPDVASVMFDPGQLEQVVLNLVVNARDAMPAGGRLTIETANVELDAADTSGRPDIAAGPCVMLAVTDNGTGMSAGTLRRIFEPFFTTKEPGHGTGLGLSTVYGIVHQSGGHMRVDSEPGQGTTFRVYLPRAQTVNAPDAASHPPFHR